MNEMSALNKVMKLKHSCVVLVKAKFNTLISFQ